jgi:hypothetical protein
LWRWPKIKIGSQNIFFQFNSFSFYHKRLFNKLVFPFSKTAQHDMSEFLFLLAINQNYFFRTFNSGETKMGINFRSCLQKTRLNLFTFYWFYFARKGIPYFLNPVFLCLDKKVTYLLFYFNNQIIRLFAMTFIPIFLALIILKKPLLIVFIQTIIIS